MTGIKQVSIFKRKLIFGTECIFAESNAYGINQNISKREEQEF